MAQFTWRNPRQLAEPYWHPTVEFVGYFNYSVVRSAVRKAAEGPLDFLENAFNSKLLGFKVSATKTSIDQLIKQLETCLADARALHLAMLERILSMALLQAHEDETDPDRDKE